MIVYVMWVFQQKDKYTLLGVIIEQGSVSDRNQSKTKHKKLIVKSEALK